MAIARRKEHVLLGMHITYCDNGTTEIRMKDYLKEAIDKFGEEITKGAVTLATRKPFEVSKNSKILDKNRNKILHSVTAKLLYVSQQGQSDL